MNRNLITQALLHSGISNGVLWFLELKQYKGSCGQAASSLTTAVVEMPFQWPLFLQWVSFIFNNLTQFSSKGAACYFCMILVCMTRYKGVKANINPLGSSQRKNLDPSGSWNPSSLEIAVFWTCCMCISFAKHALCFQPSEKLLYRIAISPKELALWERQSEVRQELLTSDLLLQSLLHMQANEWVKRDRPKKKKNNPKESGVNPK